MDVCGQHQQIHAELGGVNSNCGQFVENIPYSVVESLRGLNKLHLRCNFIVSARDGDRILESKSSVNEVTAHDLSTSDSAILCRMEYACS